MLFCCMSYSLIGMQRTDSICVDSDEGEIEEVPHNEPIRTPVPAPLRPNIVLPPSLAEISSDDSSCEEIVCNAALETFIKYNGNSSFNLKKHIKEVLQEDKKSPLIDHEKISKNVARLQSSGPTPIADPLVYIHEVVIKATEKALAEQEQIIKSQVSKKLAAVFCASFSSIFSTVVGLIVHYKGSC